MPLSRQRQATFSFDNSPVTYYTKPARVFALNNPHKDIYLCETAEIVDMWTPEFRALRQRQFRQYIIT